MAERLTVDEEVEGSKPFRHPAHPRIRVFLNLAGNDQFAGYGCGFIDPAGSLWHNICKVNKTKAMMETSKPEFK